MLTISEDLEAILEAKPDKCTSCPPDFDTLGKRAKAGKYEQCYNKNLLLLQSFSFTNFLTFLN